MPAWASNASRRGLALASSRLRDTSLFEAIGDAPLGEIVGRHFHQHLVARQHADTVLAHLARGVGDDLMPVLELYPESGVGQQFADRARSEERRVGKECRSRWSP